MDLFKHNSVTSQASQRPSSNAPTERRGEYIKRTRKFKSSDEIRAKFEAHIAKKNGPVKAELSPQAKQIEKKQAKSQEVSTQEGAEKKVNSQIDVNDPQDSNTREKLKTILKSGAFRFSGKEKDVLADILNKDS